MMDPVIDPDVKTLADLPFHVSGRFPNPAILRRCRADGFDDVSSRALFDRVRDLSLGLQALGLERGDRVALVSESRPEWVIADLAILASGTVSVPIYPILTPTQMQAILADCGARVVIVSDETQAAKLRALRAALPALEHVALIDGAPAARVGHVEAFEVPLAALAERGHHRLMTEPGLARRFREATAAFEPDRVATLIYTSGTTGEPKGVMLTHANILSNVQSTQQVIPMTADDVALSFLPLSHSFERMVLYQYLYSGVTVAFAESLDTLGRDLRAVRPTVVTGVPRVYEKLQARILDAVAEAPPWRRWIVRRALGVGRARAAAVEACRPPGRWVGLQDRLAERLVFSKIRGRIGGRLRYVVSGSAPLGRAAAEFFRAIRLPITEGYGLTEAAPVLTVNPPGAPRLGTVGTPIPGVTIRLGDDGEVLARGPNVMAGYYRKPEATRETIRDGWLHTGDVGHLDPDGYLTITDRKKDLIVTSGGKNVAPQPIEAMLKRSPLVAEAILLGDRRPCLVALIVPDRPRLEACRRAEDARREPLDRLVARPEVHDIYQSVVDEVNRDLARFEQIKRFALLPIEPSVARGELTPTLKIRRQAVTDRWWELIEALYARE